MKTCTACKGLYPHTDDWFYRNRGALMATCKRCHKQRQREYAQANPDKIRATNRGSLLKRYGITQEEYDALLASQGGGCALCGRKTQPSGHPLSVDHDHQTGEVRGILCKRCNTLLSGMENPEWYARAKEYLGT